MNRYRKRDAAPISQLLANDSVRILSNWITYVAITFLPLSVLFFFLIAIANEQIAEEAAIYVWSRAITELVLGIAYILFVYLFRKGKFWGYLRMLMTTALALVTTLSMVFLIGDYPWWLRAEQAVQFFIALLLFILLIHPVLRTRFRKKPSADGDHAIR
jgi:hypothetical protein